MSSEIKPLKIGNVKLENNMFLAPLAGFTDVAYRRLCRDFGAGLTVTEMVSVKGLCYKNANTASLLQTAPNEKPSCVQLFGSAPEFFTRALELPDLNGFDIIDINMGCPMPKVTKNGDGSALLSNIKQAAAVTEAAVKAVAITNRPVTVKIRTGQDDASINAIDMARALENSGAQLITVHGRTVRQLYGGQADWDIIGQVAAAVNIPVIGNGDIRTREDAAAKIRTYGVAGVMIGRGAIGNPQIFSNIISTQGDGVVCGFHTLLRPPVWESEFLLQTIKTHISYMQEYFPDRYTVANMRKHLAYYLKGVRGIKELKQSINTVETAGGLIGILESALQHQ